jgi:hypothetical protein
MKFALIVLLAMLVGCMQTDLHRQADKEIHAAALPELEKYWQQDAGLSKRARERRQRFARAWTLFVVMGDDSEVRVLVNEGYVDDK